MSDDRRMTIRMDRPRAVNAGARREITLDPGAAPARPKSFSPQNSLLDCARQARQARARHSAQFPKGVFRDRAWDIMIELYIAAGERRSLCMKDAMLIAEDSPAASVRRIDALEEAGLVQRRCDPDDHRRVLIQLSERGSAAMSSFLRDLYSIEGPQIETGAAKAPVSYSAYTRRL